MIRQSTQGRKNMNKTLKDDFTYHWSLATCTLEDDERVIANEQLELILQSDLFKEEKKKGNFGMETI